MLVCPSVTKLPHTMDTFIMDTYISNAAIHTARAPEWVKMKHFFDDKIQEFEIYVQNQKTLHSFFF